MSTPLQRYDSLLEDGIQRATGLMNLLEEEYRSLQHIDPEHLESVTQTKKELLKELQIFAESQDLLLKNMGYTTDREGIEHYLLHLNDGNSLRHKWHTLQDLLKRCQKQNKINSSVITVSKRQTTNVLDLLYGLAADTKTYGPGGESRSGRQSNSLGKA
jgi:flagellar biosynthesis/type III secretory pathway chaperone